MSDMPQDAKSIFFAALDIGDAAERAVFVVRSCGGDAALRQRVEELLAAYGHSKGPLDKLDATLALNEVDKQIREQVGAAEAPTIPPRDNPPADCRAETVSCDSRQEDVGAVIAGKYKLVETLGQGGMGAVFMAQQTQPVKRVVAVKLIKLGMDSKQVLARFEVERQALALMDHPNIAKVLDAGTTDSGRPFFVMELVKGVPITRFCDERQLSPRERLELFIPVCQAIQHAHQKGIIHRDIKPTNVLVALYDDRPVPKVIDFGVAKATGQQLTDASLMTSFGGIVGTPEYMSPEQAQLNQLDIDTRSDVYALGVLLYELLTGTTPIDRKRLVQGALFEVLRIIREEEPPRPSTRLSTSNALASIAATRAMEPSKLAKLMRGELDWIVMKCLEKDRSRRYETANGLARDLEHYLHDEVVEAQPPTAAYRLRKFVRKHRAALTTAATIMLLLVAGAAVSTWQAVRATRAEVQVRQERDAANAARDEAQKAVIAMDEAQGFAAGANEIAKQRLAEAEAERKRAETERDRAERQFANGLLRPIGFSTQSIDPVELRSFVDWSAIKESALKLRVLEIAFENPETALRVARRAERVIQSCVGLSPIRRVQAIKLVSAKQRDMAADPRIRAAACWLALELGSADLPAWVESCNYLSEPKNRSLVRFGGFVNFAASRIDPQQIAHLDLDPLIAILETSTNDEVRRSLCGVLQGLAPRLQPAQIERAGDGVIAILEKPTDRQTLSAASSWLAALAPRLERAQARRAGDAMIATMENWTYSFALPDDELKALVPRLEPAQVKRAGDALIALMGKSTDSGLGGLSPANSGLIALALRLEPAQVERAADALISLLQRPTDGYVFHKANVGLTVLAPRLERVQAKIAGEAMIANLENGTYSWDFQGDELKALVPRLEPAQVKHAGDALIAILEKSKDTNFLSEANDGLTVLAPRLEPAQVKRAWDAVIANGNNRYIFNQLPDLRLPNNVVTALAPRLEPAHVKRAGDAALAMLEQSTDGDVLNAARGVLTVLAPRLDPAQARRAADALVAMLQKPKDATAGTAVAALYVLAPRLDPAPVKRFGDALVAILEKSTDSSERYRATSGLQALAPRLELAQATRFADALIGTLEKSTDDSVHATATSGLQALAPRLEPAQLTRAWDALIAAPEKLTNRNRGDRGVHNDPVWAALVALAPRLEPALRDNRSTTAAAAVLDYCSSFDPNDNGLDLGPSEVANSIVVARSISSPRSLAKLLSHPACVADQRDVLLKRFEELVIHDGKLVFLKPDATDGKKPASDQLPPRRFHNLHDAADWIQKNWPDFDLETNCPVTWRGSR